MFQLPEVWLSRFAYIMPISVTQKLMLNKRCRKFLTSNHVWLEKSEALLNFSELTDYERYVMKQRDGVWYQWYLTNMLVKKFVNNKVTYIENFDGFKFRFPEIGNRICQWFGAKEKTFIVTGVRHANKPPFSFFAAPCVHMKDGKYCYVRKVDEDEIRVVESGAIRDYEWK